MFFLGVLLLAWPVSAEDQTGAELSKKPVSAAIIGASEEWQGVGKVEVTYQDGSRDLWTTKKNCAKPPDWAKRKVGR